MKVFKLLAETCFLFLISFLEYLIMYYTSNYFVQCTRTLRTTSTANSVTNFPLVQIARQWKAIELNNEKNEENVEN